MLTVYRSDERGSMCTQHPAVIKIITSGVHTHTHTQISVCVTNRRACRLGSSRACKPATWPSIVAIYDPVENLVRPISKGAASNAASASEAASSSRKTTSFVVEPPRRGFGPPSSGW